MTTMSFLEHLEELRKRLIISIVAVVVGMAIAWPLVPWVQRIITRPLNEPSITQKWHYSIESFLLQKFPDAAKGFGLEKLERPKVTPHKLNYMAPLEPFFVQMKISLITGLALAFPMILYQMWLFFAPALYPKERKDYHLLHSHRHAGLYSRGSLFPQAGLAPGYLFFHAV